ncbi:MAG: hypothetical protein HY329_07445, partial [Chloroflexi bacterium]|nr:hypothetical protein [Chloroflexota bacterium]
PATLVASMAIGLFAGTRWLSAVLLPFLGMSDWRVERPVFPGDTIWSRVSIVEARLTSDGQRYVLELRFDVFAHRGAQAPVQTGATARRTPEREERVMTFNARFLARDHRSHDVGNEPPGSRYWSCQCLTTPPTRR